MKKYSIGLDYGTESARAVLLDIVTGETAATAVCSYADGVIEKTLPGGQEMLPHEWALQNPTDWLTALEATVTSVIKQVKAEPESIVGIGVDFTSCTVLPVDAEGTPLCLLEAYHYRPHAWVKLWKHHSAAPQAQRVSQLAASSKEPWLARYGGFISSEWVMPKALQIAEEAPDIYDAARYIVEGADWITWQLTGKLTRNACAAGYKATWHKAEGFPSGDFLEELHPAMRDLFSSRLSGPVLAPGQLVGGLTSYWAKRLGLSEGTPVAAPIIDAHSGVLGAGVNGPEIMFMAMGTSTCHMLMSKKEVLIEGVAGVVEDGILPGLYAYEAGQAGVGDIFAWFVENAVPHTYQDESKQRGLSLHDILAEKASRLRPGQSGLLALDWWNGNRSTLSDADLSGLVVGCTLSTTAEEIYRALIEATAFGTRVIIDAFTGKGIPVRSIVTGGGLTRNAMLMQIYADVTGREMKVAGSMQAAAHGAAILGAVAAGQQGGYQSLTEAVSRLTPAPARVFKPIPGHIPVYDSIFQEYNRLYNYFGRGQNNVMKFLRSLRDI